MVTTTQYAAQQSAGERAVARCDLLGPPPYSDTPDGLYRGYLTPAHRAAIDRISAWMAAAGMTVTLDPAANLIGRYEGDGPAAPALLIGSHIDSVRDAGRYDGPLGIMLGIECVAALAATNRHLPFAIEVIAFGDEEGSRFPAAMLTSRAVAGTLPPAALDIADGAGVPLHKALRGFGTDLHPTAPDRDTGTLHDNPTGNGTGSHPLTRPPGGGDPATTSNAPGEAPPQSGRSLDSARCTSVTLMPGRPQDITPDASATCQPAGRAETGPSPAAPSHPSDLTPLDITRYHTAARAPGTTLAYLEAHIEQGPVLEAAGLAVGTVTGIAAQLRLAVTVAGQAGHAGTCAMPLRRDALTAAAEMILAVESIAVAAASDLVATVGRLEALPGAANVIPGHVAFTIDVRAGEAPRRDAAAAAIRAALAAIAGRRGVTLTIDQVHDLPPSPCDPQLMDLLDAATVAAGQPVRRLVSGAGHDAMVMAALCPTAMLFIRCTGGISHNPAEAVDPADADIALAVMRGFIDRLGETFA